MKRLLDVLRRTKAPPEIEAAEAIEELQVKSDATLDRVDRLIRRDPRLGSYRRISLGRRT